MPGHYGHSKAAEMVAKKKAAMGANKAGAKAMKAATLALLAKKKKNDMAVKKKSVSLKIGKHKSRSGGLTAAGRKKYNAATGSNLKAPQPQGGPRKKSFCARMGGVKGPMKDSKGRPTRKALALRKWKC